MKVNAVVGIVGKKRAGKDTVGQVFVNEHGFMRYGFADPMKAALENIFGWGAVELDGENKEQVDPFYGISPRQALQHLGTEWGQWGLCEAFPRFKETTGRKLWVNRFRKTVEFHPEVHRWVVTDVRFPHEVEVLHEMGATIIEIRRESLENSDAHASEMEMDLIEPDVVIYNDGTLQELIEATRLVARSVLDEGIRPEQCEESAS